ncbi:hypothetical protein ACFQHO_01625 [Actinomadura yumaensis]|uniref:hypothetical protein n=1 Tax=Actinomadura yumaensis TaxID=111807 RepID=UPI003609722D
MLFAIWLGGDLGVFYASRFTVRPDLSPEARSVAVKIMNGLDQCPKVCLVLFLPSGFTLMSLEPHGARVFGMAPFGPWSAAVVWIAALGWLFLAIAAHRGRSGLARRLDWAVRGALIAGSGGAAAYTLTADEPFGVTTDPRWLGGKLSLCTPSSSAAGWRSGSNCVRSVRPSPGCRAMVRHRLPKPTCAVR